MAGEKDETNVYMAKLAEQAERYDEMVDCMKAVVNSKKDTDLSLEERNLLSVAYKNVVGARRASLRIIQNIELKEMDKHSEHVQLIQTYRLKVEEELNSICTDILELLEKTLIKSATENQGTPEAVVFYQKMKADYYRCAHRFSECMAEISPSPVRPLSHHYLYSPSSLAWVC